MSARGRRGAAAVLAALGTSACHGAQSALAPGGADADAIARLTWALLAGASAILLGVAALAGLAIRDRAPRWLGRESTIWVGGIFVPAAVLSLVLVNGLVAGRDLLEPAAEDPLVIEVIGEQWWWRIRYPGPDAELATANEIRLPVDRPVELRLTTADVIHSFWVPSLAGKIDMIPGRTNRLVLRAHTAGVYRGQCAEFCGGAHAMMALHVVALEPSEFERWLGEQRAPAREPADDFARRGRDGFLAAGCGACHTVRGTPASGRLGPDLTHLGSRIAIAAGTFPNQVGTLAALIASSQHLKPGNRMPSFDGLAGAELRAIATWLAGLE
jgi:cytochrome c oxidase subunit 2